MQAYLAALPALRCGLVVGLLGAGVVACGGAPPPADTPVEASTTAPDASGEPERLESGTEAFDEAEKQLEALFLSNDGVAEPGEDPSVPKPQSQAGEPLQARDRCEVACKALASMKRSADRVCEMTGEGDTRCEHLRERVERARSRVYESCPACSAARR